MILRELLSKSKEVLKKSGINSYSLDTEIIISKVLSIDRKELFLHYDKILNELEVKEFNNLFERRKNREPISHLIGKRSFWDFDFIVNENVLDPRPDTETIIECVLKYFNDTKSNLKILDLGTGSGAIILTLLNIFKNAKGTAVDINKKSLEIAELNAKNFNLLDRLDLINSNWNENVNGKFDIIVSNPPYIPSEQIKTLEDEVKNYEPIVALDGGNDGLNCYREISSQIGKNMTKNTVIFLEIGENQEDDIEKIFLKNKIKLTEKVKDLNGTIRTLVLREV